MQYLIFRTEPLMVESLVLPLLAYIKIGNKKQVTYKATTTIPSPTTPFYVFLISCLRFVASSSLLLWKLQKGNYRSSFCFCFSYVGTFNPLSLVLIVYSFSYYVFLANEFFLVRQVLKDSINNQLALKQKTFPNGENH